MKTFWKDMILALLMGVALPSVMIPRLIVTEQSLQKRETQRVEMVTESTEQEKTCRIILRLIDGTSAEMELEEYLVGVVLAEMPAYFEEEALKAQAVVARTYTLKTCMVGGKHADGIICSDSCCCQAYLSVMDYLQRGGTGESVDKVRSAVLDTSGQVLIYDGELIEATYFSCSGGLTEDAQAVWGTEYPYLKSVASPGEENAAHFSDVVSFSFQELEKKLGIALSEKPDQWFGAVTYTAGSGVKTIEIGGIEYTGTQLRNLLGLRSTMFDVVITEDSILFYTRGFGHRVGMSQYGADAMAANGSTYKEILAYYYQGTELTDIESVG